jgi:hypothetical protein
MTDEPQAAPSVRRFNHPARFFSDESINCDEPIIFHYTTAAGALGILSSGQMWCTSAAHLNDSTDCRHIYDVAISIAATHLQGISRPFLTAVLAEMREQSERYSGAKVFLRDRGQAARGWLIEMMKCVDQLGRSAFTLDEVYAFEDRLAAIYPGNNNIRPKIRQQLQELRDQGYLSFLGRGRYRVRAVG